MSDRASLFDQGGSADQGGYRGAVIAAVRQAGERKALDAEDPDWLEHAQRVLEDFASSGESFNADDVRAVVGDPIRSSSLGALFGQAARRRLIRPAGVETSRRISRHGGLQRRWIGTERGTVAS